MYKTGIVSTIYSGSTKARLSSSPICWKGRKLTEIISDKRKRPNSALILQYSVLELVLVIPSCFIFALSTQRIVAKQIISINIVDI